MLGLKTLNQRVFADLSTKSRQQKGELLRRHFAIDEDTKVLDIGGQLDAAGQQILESHPNRANITVLNLDGAVDPCAVDTVARAPHVTSAHLVTFG